MQSVSAAAAGGLRAAVLALPGAQWAGGLLHPAAGAEDGARRGVRRYLIDNQ